MASRRAGFRLKLWFALAAFSIAGTIPVSRCAAVEAEPVEIGRSYYDAGVGDVCNDISLDSYGNIYLTGYSHNGTNSDFRTIKYDAAWNILWNKVYDSGRIDYAHAIAVDSFGNVCVTGETYTGFDYYMRTIKYDPDGNILWNKIYNSSDLDVAHDIAVDSFGNAYVTGYASVAKSDVSDFRTIKYDPDGNVIWNKVYDSGVTDRAFGVAVDFSGNVYVTGVRDNAGDEDVSTVKYDPDGNIVWAKAYDGGSREKAFAIALDSFGNPHVAGGIGLDILVIKYDQSGNIMWDRSFDCREDWDFANGISVDASGAVYASGQCGGDGADFLTVKYDSSGNLVWNKVSGDDHYERAESNAVDSSGNIYVTGYSSDFTAQDFLTLIYRPNFTPLLAWTGEGGYEADGVSPDKDYPGDFTYHVRYSDPDGDAPKAGQPRVWISKGGVELPGSPFPMTYVSGDYGTGAIYAYSANLTEPGMDYAYVFEGSDMFGAAATGEPTLPMAGPVVEGVSVRTMRVFPNPYNRRLAVRGTVKFEGMALGSQVRIYSVRGLEVWKGVVQTPYIIEWDGMNDTGKPVAPGTYMWIVKGAEGTARGTLIVE